MRSRLIALLLAAGTCASPVTNATLTYSALIVDPLGQATSSYSGILSALDASMATWGNYLEGTADYSIQIEITEAIPRGGGASFASSLVGFNGAYFVYEQGATYELRTGIDPNGDLPDIHILLNPSYVSTELWFDPDPHSRTAPVPANRTDAVSVFLHELGHVFAFNGWGDLTTAVLPSNYASTWDVLTSFDGHNVYFNGPVAEALYGGPVPVTRGNNFHLGNALGPGTDLVPDLMNGEVYSRGTRYDVSPLDLAIFEDVGVPVVANVPEPASYALLVSGLVVILLRAARVATTPTQTARAAQEL